MFSLISRAVSIAIATFGLLNNSAAVVIGAMLVAPLMTPMMGYSAAMVMAWPRRQAWALTVVSISAAYGIALAILLSLFVPTGSELGGLPSEVLARTEPNFLDLFIALAAGAAGAYVTVHPRVGAALPGVVVNPVSNSWFHPSFAERTLREHFRVADLGAFGLASPALSQATAAAGAGDTR